MTIRSKTIRLRMTEEEERDLKEQASSFYAKTVSQYIRDCIKLRKFGYTVSVANDIKEIKRELSAIGNNLNQIARFCNGTKQFHDIEKQLASIKKLQEKLRVKIK